MGAERARPPRAGGARAVRRARLRADDRGRDRRAGRADRAHVLPPLHRQARGALRRRRASCRSSSSATLACAPASAAPIDAVGLRARGSGRGCSRSRRTFARQRQAVIAANAELQERELIKLAALARRWPARCASAASQSRRRASSPRRASPCSGWPSSAGSTIPRNGISRGSSGVARRAQGRDRRDVRLCPGPGAEPERGSRLPSGCDFSSKRPPQRRHRGARRPWQDHPRRRDALADRRLPRRPGRGRADHGQRRSGA